MSTAKVIIIPISAALIFLAIYQITKKKPSAVIERIKSKIGLINPKFKYLDIREGFRSETEDKSLITLCVKDPDTGKEYSLNTLIYVTLHEVAHVLNKPEYDEHGSEWQAIFTKLLEQAEEKGIYTPTLALEPVYCGIDTTGSASATWKGVHQIAKANPPKPKATSRFELKTFRSRKKEKIVLRK
jgi:hypothetical protein